MSSSNHKRGFSLVELMVALGLVGMVFTVSSLMYFSGVKAWMRWENQAEVRQNLRIAMNTLYNEIKMADRIDVYSDGRKIDIYYNNDVNLKDKSYIFKPHHKELWLDDSNGTVAMYIEDLRFQYRGDLLLISITTQAKEGAESRNYVFRIYTRGKKINVVD